MLKYCAEIWDEVRKRRPLVHCITNYVTVNDVANIILASGASPAMVEYPAEASGFAPSLGALLLIWYPYRGAGSSDAGSQLGRCFPGRSHNS